MTAKGEADRTPGIGCSNDYWRVAIALSIGYA